MRIKIWIGYEDEIIPSEPAQRFPIRAMGPIHRFSKSIILSYGKYGVSSFPEAYVYDCACAMGYMRVTL